MLHYAPAKSLLRRFSRIDSWFIAKSGLNLYRGCAHDCLYCDGRSEKYRVDGDFGSDVLVKSNAREVLRRELRVADASQLELWQQGTRRRAGGATAGFVVLGGGVGDSYQPAESSALASRHVLELFADLGVPVHILTKSALVLRDADLIERIREKAGALVSFSLSSSDHSISARFEPGASRPSERLAALAKLRDRGIPGGVFLLPVIPFVTDSPEVIGQSIKAACDAGAQYIIFGGMTLKPGRQKDHFLAGVRSSMPEIEEKIASLYREDDRRGNAKAGYYAGIEKTFAGILRRHGIPPRIPLRLFPRDLQGRDLAIVLLDQIHAMLTQQGATSPCGREAARIAKLPTPLDPAGLDGPCAALVREILETGTCKLYESLIAGAPIT